MFIPEQELSRIEGSYDIEERLDIMREEEITETQVWGEDRMEYIEPVLPMEVSTEVPGMEAAILCGDPISLGSILDFQQGFDNPYGCFGTCGLNSIANLCVMGGKEVTEPEVVEFAMENDLCEKNDEKMHGGATTLGNELQLLEHYGFPAHCEFANETGSPERIAAAIEGGHGVLMALNSGVLQDREWKVHNQTGEITATHMVCMTGTVRDPKTGELCGFYLCDSSGQRADSGRTFVSLEKLEKCYSDVRGGVVIVTDDPIRTGYNYQIS